MRARTFILHSMPVPVTMPSLIAAWGSPKKTSASIPKPGDRPGSPGPRLLIEIAAIGAGVRGFVALRRHRRDRAEIGVEPQRNASVAAEPGAAVVHRRGERHRLRELAAQHPEIPQDRTLADTERDQLYQVNRDDVAGLGTTHDNRSGYRRQRMPVASRREWCRYCADVLARRRPAYLGRELLAGSDGHRMTEKRYSVRFALMYPFRSSKRRWWDSSKTTRGRATARRYGRVANCVGWLSLPPQAMTA
jgi:hypothetical protein